MSARSNWRDLPLVGDGRSVVEASAGTGKTWTIGVVYLRLLLEQALLPQQIIVATFTNAAASELSERLRARLRWAAGEAAQFSGQPPDTDAPDDQAWLLQRWVSDPAGRDRDARRLQAALSHFDRAPIGTLHTLCSRILSEHPFAAGVPFHGHELVNGKQLRAGLATDLWRVIDQGDEADEWVRAARAADVSRKTIDSYVPALVQATVRTEALDPAQLVQGLRSIVGDLDTWSQAIQTVLDTPGLMRNTARLATAWRALHAALMAADGSIVAAIAAQVGVLRGADALTGVNALGKAHAGLLKLADQSVAIAQSLDPLTLDRAANPVLRRFLNLAQHWCRQTLAARLAASQQTTFDALIETVHHAIQPQEGQRALADALFATWPVALVDEFQDTDPLQYAILDAIYRDAEGQARGRWVMIGDPKQAIYRFRGGDIQTYRRAVRTITDADRLTLGTNFRSSRAYVAAINDFYRLGDYRVAAIDSSDPLAYLPVDASARRDGETLCARDSGTVIERPLVLHVLAADNPSEDLEADALRACAGHIVKALSPQGYRIGEAALRPDQIAVLLPGHKQIEHLKRLMQARGVPCITRSQNTVFASDSARDLRLILHAVVHPENPDTLRAALITPLCGLSLGAIQALQDDALTWEREVARFAQWHALLTAAGPLAIVTKLIEHHAARVLRSVDGERILTDLRHLGELLQAAWDEGAHEEQLLAWLADQVDKDNDEDDAADTLSLRLESDAGRVQLMTLHASKGLEFPVVFLPLMWKHKAKPKRGAQLLAATDGLEKDIVLGPAQALINQQETDERHRLLYVALTRAIHACHVFCLPMGSPATALIEKQMAAADVPLNERVKAVLAKLSAADAIACHFDWENHRGVRPVDTVAAPMALNARTLPPALSSPLPNRHSFSTLAHVGQRRIAIEEAAADEQSPEGSLPFDAPPSMPAAPVTQHPELEALATVAGPAFGNAVHHIFEHRALEASLREQHALVRYALDSHGVKPSVDRLDDLVETLALRLQAVLDTELRAGFRLADVPAWAQRSEMEFNYALDRVQVMRLREVCAQHGEPELVPAYSSTLLGLMNGKIDLVFEHEGRVHVLDWKSNRLGDATQAGLEAYASTALESAMQQHRYRLQALLYTVAVERYLRERLGARYRREQHLGDCWYLFIRATGLSLPDGRGCGVWHHRFSDALLDAVQTELGAST